MIAFPPQVTGRPGGPVPPPGGDIVAASLAGAERDERVGSLTTEGSQPGEPEGEGAEPVDARSGSTSRSLPVSPDATAVAAPAALRREREQAATERGGTGAEQTGEGSAVSTRQGTGATKNSTSFGTPLEALQMDEVARTRSFVQICIGIVVLTAIFLPQLGGDPMARNVLYAGLGQAAVVFAWTLYRIRHDDTYRVGLITPFALSMVTGAFTAVYYFGIFSAAASVVVLGIYFFSLGAAPRATLFIYVLSAGVQLALAILVTQDVIADRGLVRADDLSRYQMLLYQGLIEMM